MMKKLTVPIACLLVFSGQSALAETVYQYPSQLPVYTAPVAPAVSQTYPGYPAQYLAYPQQPAYYYPPQYLPAYPATQTGGMLPYAYPQPVTQNMQAAQPAPPVYASPYDPGKAATPGPKAPPPPVLKKEVKPWGDTRYIWPDFYTEATGDWWDKVINAPNEMGYMPGGWRFPSFSSPDPVTVGDAIANQVPPVLEEVPNFMDFAN